ncbi:TRAP transporter small permease [Rhodobium gokarnense]|uniref:TRAP transporter small permease protein n=1 Tax=Rhodobium gokarnense TaxID=364296 RepID=A0ABT3HAJ7_9HYPH|nr:TRAP transporter small permease [Rhodobium gokarnense]MCW2307349.1 TRAP-type C4-dicarboxylate transport system permease small subunit [Rhodobium gokarnense]
MRPDRIIELFEEIVSVLTLGVIVVLVLVQVFFRYVLSSGLLWVDELVINLMVLLVLVGAALATRNGAHIDLRLIVNGLQPWLRLVLKVLGTLVTIVFLLVLIWASAGYAYDSRNLATTMIGIPLWLAYGTIPLGGVLILYEFLKLTVRSVRDGTFNSDEVAP